MPKYTDEEYAEMANYANEQGKVLKISLEGELILDDSPPPTLEEVQNMFTAAIQGHLDTFARTRNYDNILSAATYATSTVPKFRAEGQYAVEARDATWAKGYEILDQVMSGQRPMPALDDVLAELPVLAWPA